MPYSFIGRTNSRPQPNRRTRTKTPPELTSTRFRLAKIRGSRVRIDCAPNIDCTPNIAYFGKLDPRFAHHQRVLLRAGRKEWQMFGRRFQQNRRFFSVLVGTITSVKVLDRRRLRPLQFRRRGWAFDDEALFEIGEATGGPMKVVARDLVRCSWSSDASKRLLVLVFQLKDRYPCEIACERYR